jgi:hypothetical protein
VGGKSYWPLFRPTAIYRDGISNGTIASERLVTYAALLLDFFGHLDGVVCSVARCSSSQVAQLKSCVGVEAKEKVCALESLGIHVICGAVISNLSLVPATTLRR